MWSQLMAQAPYRVQQSAQAAMPQGAPGMKAAPTLATTSGGCAAQAAGAQHRAAAASMLGTACVHAADLRHSCLVIYGVASAAEVRLVAALLLKTQGSWGMISHDQ